MSVCEGCYRRMPMDNLGWDLFCQHWICPDCQFKLNRDKTQPVDLRSGRYSEGKPDPRGETADLPVIEIDIGVASVNDLVEPETVEHFNIAGLELD